MVTVITALVVIVVTVVVIAALTIVVIGTRLIWTVVAIRAVAIGRLMTFLAFLALMSTFL